MSIQFEGPFQGTCARHQGLLYKDTETRSAFIDFKQEGLKEIPNVIVREEVRFEFKGVSEGQAIYREEYIDPSLYCWNCKARGENTFTVDGVCRYCGKSFKEEGINQ
jgi:hypothetical protein